MNGARGALIQRLLASRQFANAEALKRILVYLCERAEASEDVQPKEFEIAVNALGRPESFDPRTDPIVRVHIGSIRERLESYFENEGRRESLRLEIPRGRYRAVFTEVKVAPSPGVDDRVGPALERFWGPYMHGPAANVLVFSDLLFLRNDEGTFVRNIQVNDLATAKQDLAERLPGVDFDGFAPSFHFASAGEMEAILAIVRGCAAMSIPLEVVKTRFTSWNALRRSNLVLLGSARTNPFLDALQGDGDFFITRHRIENRRPRDDEQPIYVGTSRKDGKLEIMTEYAVVSRRPGLGPGLAVTTIASNHGRAIEGAGDFVTSERRMHQLFDELSIAAGADLPEHFQLLLRVDLVDFDEEVAEVRCVASRLGS